MRSWTSVPRTGRVSPGTTDAVPPRFRRQAAPLARSPQTRRPEVHESADDIDRVQALLDRSYAAAGPHLRSIHTEQRRLTAADLVVRLQGMCLLVLATVNSAGRHGTR